MRRITRRIARSIAIAIGVENEYQNQQGKQSDSPHAVRRAFRSDRETVKHFPLEHIKTAHLAPPTLRRPDTHPANRTIHTKVNASPMPLISILEPPVMAQRRLNNAVAHSANCHADYGGDEGIDNQSVIRRLTGLSARIEVEDVKPARKSYCPQCEKYEIIHTTHTALE